MYVLEHQRFMLDASDPDSPPTSHPAFSLALAKLLFKDDRGPEALAEAAKVMDSLSGESDDGDRRRAADAYYLCGWIAIHMDDHTGAYKYWADGHRRLPQDGPLARQVRSCEEQKTRHGARSGRRGRAGGAKDDTSVLNAALLLRTLRYLLLAPRFAPLLISRLLIAAREAHPVGRRLGGGRVRRHVRRGLTGVRELR